MDEKIDRLRALAVRLVTEAGARGVPADHFYSSLMEHGITVPVYQFIIVELVEQGKLRKRGEFYFSERK